MMPSDELEVDPEIPSGPQAMELEDPAAAAGEQTLDELADRLARHLAAEWMVDWDGLTTGDREARCREARGILAQIGVAAVVEERDSRAFYKPCEPCRRGDHDHCTGDCSSMCCALEAAEQEIERIGELAARRVEELETRLADAPCVVEEHEQLADRCERLAGAIEKLGAARARFRDLASVEAFAAELLGELQLKTSS